MRRLWRSLTPPPAEKFTPELVADLPETVRRYFLHAIQPGTLASSAQVDYSEV